MNVAGALVSADQLAAVDVPVIVPHCRIVKSTGNFKCAVCGSCVARCAWALVRGTLIASDPQHSNINHITSRSISVEKK
jgi:hypothetical protein